MQSPVPARRGIPAVLAVGSLFAGLVLTSAAGADASAAVVPGGCPSAVSALKLQSERAIAGQGGTVQQYRASVDYPRTGGGLDQTALALLSRFGPTATATLLRAQIGDTSTTGDMVQSQEPTALAAVNGDFFITPSVGGTRVPMSRGPMVSDGEILRADRQQDRVVGVDAAGRPFAGTLGLRGRVRTAGTAALSVTAVNWQGVQPDGVTVFTPAWSGKSSAPRPAGAAEWVIDRRNTLTAVRTPNRNAGALGAPVEAHTRVLAFAKGLRAVAADGVLGARVRVILRQVTDTGVQLGTAIGRGLALVRHGVVAPLGCKAYAQSSEARPRTVVGWTKSRSWRVLTVPGAAFVGGGFRDGGFGLANTAALARELGMTYAYVLDGGGSTTLYTRSRSDTWVRRDLVGVTGGDYERPVTNGLAFVSGPP